VGKKRRIELIKHFKSIENIKKASVEDLKEVRGITETVAKNIYVYFN
jgi:excinuclease ABC subunit C